jgi:hypothetical protein
MSEKLRFLALRAGPFRVALPLTAVRQILDMGGATATTPLDPRSLGVAPVSLARVLGAEPTSEHPALLLFEGSHGPLLLTADALEGVVDAPAPRPLPSTVSMRFPALVAGTVEHEGLLLAFDPATLVDVVEIRQGELEPAHE